MITFTTPSNKIKPYVCDYIMNSIKYIKPYVCDYIMNSIKYIIYDKIKYDDGFFAFSGLNCYHINLKSDFCKEEVNLFNNHYNKKRKMYLNKKNKILKIIFGEKELYIFFENKAWKILIQCMISVKPK